MTLVKKSIGRVPQSFGNWSASFINPKTQLAGYGKKFRVFLYGCEFESLMENNTYAPMTLDESENFVEDTTHWRRVTGNPEVWRDEQDKPAVSEQYPYNGMGRVILKKNMVNGVNTLTQDMFYKGEAGSRVPNTNTIFVIKYDFDLDGAEITVPADCVLEFEGGSLSNGTLTGTDTQIKAQKTSIFTGITIAGTWNVPYITSDWFGDAKTVDDTLKQAFNLCSDDVYNTLTVEKGDYWVRVLQDKSGALEPTSNLRLELLGNIRLRGHAFPAGVVIWFKVKNNISIVGSGCIYGDKLTHVYDDGLTHPDGYVNPDGPTDEYTQPTHEGCHAIAFSACENVLIDGIHIYDATADGIDVLHSSIEYNNIIIRNFYIQGCRRQGITFGAVNGIIENGIIKGIRGTNPQAGIDIEISNNTTTHKAKRILIRNLAIDDCVKGIQAASYVDTPAEQDLIKIDNVEITNCHTGIICYSNVKECAVTNSLISVKYYSDNINRYTKQSALSFRPNKGVVYNCSLIGDSESLPVDPDTGEKMHTYIVDCGGETGDITIDKCTVNAPDFYFSFHHSDFKAFGNYINCYGMFIPVTVNTNRCFYSNNNLLLGKGGLIANPTIEISNNIIIVSNEGQLIIQGGLVKANYIVLYKDIIIKGKSSFENNSVTYFADTTEGGDEYSCIRIETNIDTTIKNNKFTLNAGTVGNIRNFIYIIGNKTVGNPVIVTDNILLNFDFSAIKFVLNGSSGSLVGLVLKRNIVDNGISLPSTGTGEDNRIFNNTVALGTYSFAYKNCIAGVRTNGQYCSLFTSSSPQTDKQVCSPSFCLKNDISVYIGDDHKTLELYKIKYNGVVDFRYCANLSAGLTVGKDVYLKFNYDSSDESITMISDGATFVQELPTVADACAYVLFGKAVTGTHVQMTDRQYKYIFVNGNLTLYSSGEE